MVPPSPDSSSNWMSPGSISSASWSASAFRFSACLVYVSRSVSKSSRCSARNFLSCAVSAFLAGTLTGFAAGDFVTGVFAVGCFAVGGLAAALAGVLVAFTVFAADLERAAVFGGGGVALLARVVLATLLAVAVVRRAVEVFTVRPAAALDAVFAVAFRVPAADFVCPRADCFAVDLVALGMVFAVLPDKGWRTVPHAPRQFGNPPLAERGRRVL